jgi:hypothetical protein
MRIGFRYFVVLVFTAFQWSGQCADQVRAFKAGEKITYQAHYVWGLVKVYAGDVQFTVSQYPDATKPVLSFEAVGQSLPKWDWMYKVRDNFQSRVNIETFSPIWADRNTLEGSYTAKETYNFSAAKRKIYYSVVNSENPLKRDSLAAGSRIFDVLTLIYYCRTIDFQLYKKDDKIPVKMVVDGKIYPLYLRYLGKEIVKNYVTKQRYNCIKLAVLLVPGTIFKGGEDMNIWVTDDENRIPIQVQAKIIIGSIYAYLNTMEGVTNEMKSKVN